MSNPPKPSFATTCWSEVRRAAKLTGEASDSLERLCAAYWYPLYAYLRRSGHDPEQAQDYVQSFFVDLLSRDSLRSADPGRGRFRSFLLTACRNHVANLNRADRSLRRGGGRHRISMETRDGERRYETEPIEKWTAEKLYERRWALAVMDAARSRVRKQYEAKGKADRFDALCPLIAPAGTPPSHAEIADQLQCSVGSIKVAAHRLRQEFGTALREEIADTMDVCGDDSGVAEVNDELCYIVMEFVAGTTLREAMSASAVDPASALRIVPQICDALAYAHENGVVHRDIKPENILLGTGGKVKVVDFGLAKMSDDERSQTMLTATGARLGTLRYMAPEQLDGTTVDHRADVYSLGVVFYEMLTGQVPMGQYAMPSEKSGVDPRIDEVVMRTLNREPAERYQRASDIEQELQSISDGGFGWLAAGSRPSHGWHRHSRGNSQYAWHARSREWKSKSTIFGYPTVHLADGFHPRTGKKLVAKGLIAIGDIAVGGLAIGGVSLGVVSFGGLALGVNAMGGMAVGLQMAAGGGAIGTVALGDGTLGALAIGGGAIGLLAIAGGAMGKIAIGDGCYGSYILDRRGQWSPPEFADTAIASLLADQRLPFVGAFAIFLMTFGPLLLIAALALVGKTRSAARGITDAKMPPEVRHHLWGSLWGVCVVPLVLPVLFAVMAGQIGKQFREAADIESPAAAEPAGSVMLENQPIDSDSKR